MEFEFVVEMNLVQIGTNEFFPQLIRLAANERAPTVPPVQQPEIGETREPCEPQPCSLGERNVFRDLAAVLLPLSTESINENHIYEIRRSPGSWLSLLRVDEVPASDGVTHLGKCGRVLRRIGP